jgi:hypothetical protein
VEITDAPTNYLVFAHQNKFTATGKTSLSTKTIAAEMQKVNASFSKWKTAIATDPHYSKFTNSQVVLVIFTNRKITLHERNYTAKTELYSC